MHCLRTCSEEADAAKLAEEEEEARREAEFQELKRKKMEELEQQLALVRSIRALWQFNEPHE